MNPDVAIVGGGIVGAACADACAAAGLCVVVVEHGVEGGGATGAGMGHLTVMDDSEAQFALTRCSVDLWNRLGPELPANVEYTPCGTLWVAADEEEMGWVRRKHAWHADRGLRTEILDAAALTEAEPNLRRGLAGALRVPCDSVIYQPAATRFLLDRSRAGIVRVRATAIGEGSVRLADGGQLSAGAVVNAAGVDAPRLTPGIEIEPRKGHLLITDRLRGFARHQLVELGYLKSAHGSRGDSVAFNLQPRATGQLLIGSSRQMGATGPEVEPRMLSWMLRRAVEFMPALRSLPAIRAWTGFRPCTPDNLPYIGLAPGARSIYVAAGHEGLGIATSLATGLLIAAAIAGGPTPVPPAPYDPARKAAHAHSH